MRIVVIGDLQYQQGEEESVRATMRSIAALHPDLTVAMGDYGSHQSAGSEAGIKTVYDMLLECGGELRMLVGNHDLQIETGTGAGAVGSIERLVRSLCGVDSTHGVLEYAGFRLLFLSCDLQPKEQCICRQECYLTEESFQSLTQLLDARPGVPVIVFSHAPILGCGLQTVPNVHVRATNAFLDQNHNPGRWVNWIRSHPQIKLWFSAHYHLSPENPGALSRRYGVTFLGCGAPTSASRDGMHQSRMLEIAPHADSGKLAATVSIFDHDSGMPAQAAPVLVPLDPIHRPVPFQRPPAPIPTDSPSISCACNHVFRTACGKPLANGLAYRNGRLYAATDIGYLWEVDAIFGEAMGTWGLLGDNTDGLCLSENLLWRYDGNKLLVGDTGSPRRFARDPCDPEQIRYETFFPDSIIRLHPAAGGAVFVHTHGAVWLCRLEGDEIRKEGCNKALHAIPHNELRLHGGYLQVYVSQSAGWVTLMTGTPVSAYTVVANGNRSITAWVVSPGADHDLCFQNLEIHFLPLRL
ncbi:MAG: hypothetical protein HFG26_00530 [Provencibacterium sp.]|nr:hypothetical protein [Provencibacterium sp.]